MKTGGAKITNNPQPTAADECQFYGIEKPAKIILTQITPGKPKGSHPERSRGVVCFSQILKPCGYADYNPKISH